MANEEYFNEMMKNKQEKKNDEFEAKICGFDEKINDLGQKFGVLMEKIENLGKNNLLPNNNTPQPQNSINDFSSIENFARAMSALRSYENNVINGYEQLRQKAQQEIINSVSDSDQEDDIGDQALKFLFNQLGNNNSNMAAAPSTTHTPISAAPFTPQTGAKMDEQTTFNVQKAAAEVPNNIKAMIRNGTIDKKTIIKEGKAAVAAKGIEVTENQLSDVYEHIKAEK